MAEQRPEMPGMKGNRPRTTNSSTSRDLDDRRMVICVRLSWWLRRRRLRFFLQHALDSSRPPTMRRRHDADGEHPIAIRATPCWRIAEPRSTREGPEGCPHSNSGITVARRLHEEQKHHDRHEDEGLARVSSAPRRDGVGHKGGGIVLPPYRSGPRSKPTPTCCAAVACTLRVVTALAPAAQDSADQAPVAAVDPRVACKILRAASRSRATYLIRQHEPSGLAAARCAE